jgi:hypothetical protein
MMKDTGNGAEAEVGSEHVIGTTAREEQVEMTEIE